MKMIDYLEAARARLAPRGRRREPSWNQLSFALGHTSNSMVSRWKRGEDIPGPDDMIRLAELAGLNPDRAILDRASWRAAKDAQPAAAARFAALAARVVAPLVLVLALLAPAGSTAYAAAPEPTSQIDCILWKIRRRLRRWSRFWPMRAALASLVLAALATVAPPAAAADCDTPAVASGALMPQLDAAGYRIKAWFRLGTRKQAFILANAVRDVVVLRVTLPAAPPADGPADGPAAGAPPAALPAGEVCVIWRGADYMALQVLPPLGAGL